MSQQTPALRGESRTRAPSGKSRGLDVSPGIEAEVYCGKGEDRGLELREGKLGSCRNPRRRGSACVSSGTGGWPFPPPGARDDLENFFSRGVRPTGAIFLTTSTGLPAPRLRRGGGVFESSLYDPALFTRPLQEWAPILFDMQERASGWTGRAQGPSGGIREGRSEVAIASTAGVRAYERGRPAASAYP